MGECFITRRGGESESYKVPILDPNYPKDVSLVESENGIATFEIKISKDGSPATYTYQWYCDDVAIEGETSSTYTVKPEDINKKIKIVVSGTGYYRDTKKAETVIVKTAVQIPRPPAQSPPSKQRGRMSYNTPWRCTAFHPVSRPAVQ